MKISTKGRYGMLLLLDICVNGASAPVSLRAASGRLDISEKYLEQIIMPMAKAGLVKSVRGAAGGYLLSRSASDITLGEALSILEGGVCVADCARGDWECPKKATCAAAPAWDSLTRAIREVAYSMTLMDILLKNIR